MNHSPVHQDMASPIPDGPAQTASTQPSSSHPHPTIIPDPPVNPNPTSVYSMVTRFRVESNKPTQRLNFHVSTVSPLPKTYRDAFLDSNWTNAMQDEYNALIKNRTWTLVPRPPDANVVRCMWLFRHKFLADGTLSRYKAWLVANGSTQLEGVDVDETFSPVVKPGTICTVLSLDVSRHWPVHQLDVKNAFLHGDLSETVYMHQPPGFQDSSHPDYVCLLQRSLYGLKQAPRAWFQRFASYITRVGFHRSRCDTSLFIYRQGLDTAYLLLYVDDIVLTASSSELLQRIIRSLHQEFAMTDLGSLNYFLGISVSRDSSGMFLSQKKYAVEILERANMVNCNPSRTPVDTESKLGNAGDEVSDLTLYRSLAGSLQYLTFTRPDIFYVVQQVCLYMHDPREPHFSALKRILRYIRGTLEHGLQLFSSTTSDLVAYSDADWAGCPTTRCSTSGYCVFLGNNLLSWSSKSQPTLSRSSAEAEYRGVANAVAETCWLRNLLRELHTPLSSTTLVYCDNVSAVYLSCNPVQHQRTKHIEIDIYFVRGLVAAGQVRVLHVPSRYQFADIFTKGLPSYLFEEFRSSLSVRCPPAQTAGNVNQYGLYFVMKKIEHDDIALLTSSVTQLYTSVFLVGSKSIDIKVSDAVSKPTGSNTTYTYINEALNCQTTSQHWLEKKAENTLRVVVEKADGGKQSAIVRPQGTIGFLRYVKSCHPQVRKTNVLCVTTGKALETTSYNTDRVKEIIDNSTSRGVSKDQRVGSTSSQTVNNLEGGSNSFQRFYEVEQALKERERHPINQRVKHPPEPISCLLALLCEISLQADRGNGVMCLTMSCKAVYAKYLRRWQFCVSEKPSS
ncbi:ribonuclease H-like domain-containing protein [Tanacetum coccineum]